MTVYGCHSANQLASKYLEHGLYGIKTILEIHKLIGLFNRDYGRVQRQAPQPNNPDGF